MTNKTLSCTSWISGKHSESIEINTKLPYVAIYDFFAQGDDAENVINEINAIYNRDNCTPLQACEKWANLYL
jgi:hypothetical protein